LKRPGKPRLPDFYLEGTPSADPETMPAKRVKPVHLPPEARFQSFAEVESCLTAEEADLEAKRCLRCDLEFTQPGGEVKTAGEKRAA
jgi:hypothetical protein